MKPQASVMLSDRISESEQPTLTPGRATSLPNDILAGRPSKSTPAIVDELCERIINGEPLTKICRDGHMPSFGTVWRWEREDEEFRELATRALRYGTHYLAHECIEIADGSDDPATKRIRIDTRLRLIGKWNSKAYGDKIDVTTTDPAARPMTFAEFYGTPK